MNCRSWYGFFLIRSDPVSLDLQTKEKVAKVKKAQKKLTHASSISSSWFMNPLQRQVIPMYMIMLSYSVLLHLVEAGKTLIVAAGAVR